MEAGDTGDYDVLPEGSEETVTDDAQAQPEGENTPAQGGEMTPEGE